MSIYDILLSPDDVMQEYFSLANDNGMIGGRIVRIQCLFRGYRARKSVKEMKDKLKPKGEQSAE
jgi:hypothetical protein